jgi:hypothetical protein
MNMIRKFTPIKAIKPSSEIRNFTGITAPTNTYTEKAALSINANLINRCLPITPVLE